MAKETIDELAARMASYSKPDALPQQVYITQEPSGTMTTLETDVWIPAAQAIIISVAWGSLAGVVVEIVLVCLSLPWWIAIVSGGIVGLLLLAVQVTKFIKERRELMWKRERIEGRDIDGDGAIGDPTVERQHTRVTGRPTVETEQHLWRLAGEDGQVRVTRALDGTRVYVAHLLEVVEYGLVTDVTRTEGIRGFTVSALEQLLSGKPRPDAGGNLRQYVGAILDKLESLGIITERGGPGNKTAQPLVSLAEARKRIGEK